MKFLFNINVNVLLADTDFVADSQSNIIFNVNYKKFKLQFEIEIGEESSNFASEVIRASESMFFTLE